MRRSLAILLILILFTIYLTSCKSILPSNQSYSNNSENIKSEGTNYPHITDIADIEDIDYSSFPENIVPIYNDSQIVLYEQYDYDSSLKYTTENDIQDIIDFYFKEFENCNYQIRKLDLENNKCYETTKFTDSDDIDNYEYPYVKDQEFYEDEIFVELALLSYYNDNIGYFIMFEQPDVGLCSIKGKKDGYNFQINLTQSLEEASDFFYCTVEIVLEDYKAVSPEIEPEIIEVEIDDTYIIENATVYSVIGGYIIESVDNIYNVNSNGLFTRTDIIIGDLKEIDDYNQKYDNPEKTMYIASTDFSPYENMYNLGLNDSSIEKLKRAASYYRAHGIFNDYPYGEAYFMALYANPICKNTTIIVQKHEYGTAVFADNYGLFVSKNGVKSPPPFLPEFNNDDEFALYLMRTYNDVFAAYSITEKYAVDTTSVSKKVYDEASSLILSYDLNKWYYIFYSCVAKGESKIDEIFDDTSPDIVFMEFLDSFHESHYREDFSSYTSSPNNMWFSDIDLAEFSDGKNFLMYRGHDMLYLFKLRDDDKYIEKINQVIEGYYLTYDAYSNPNEKKVEKVYNCIINDNIDFLQAHCIFMNSNLEPYIYQGIITFSDDFNLCLDNFSNTNINTEYGEMKYYTFVNSVDLFFSKYKNYENTKIKVFTHYTMLGKQNQISSFEVRVLPVDNSSPMNYSTLSEEVQDCMELQKYNDAVTAVKISDKPYVGDYRLVLLKDEKGNILYRNDEQSFWWHSFILLESGEILSHEYLPDFDGTWTIENNKIIIKDSQFLENYFIEDDYFVIVEDVELFKSDLNSDAYNDALSNANIIYGYYKEKNYE